MPSFPRSPAWQALADHHRSAGALHLRELLTDPARTDALTFELDGLVLDLSKNRVTGETLNLLCALAEEQGVEARRAAMVRGEIVNASEGRAALHMALRAGPEDGFSFSGKPVYPDVGAVLDHMAGFADAVRSGARTGATGQPLRDVVNIGIGGSDQGPRLVCRALAPHLSGGPNPHFVSNVDAADLMAVLAGCDPATTLFVVSSKTFTTQETMTNAHSARRWLTDALSPDVVGPDAVVAHFCAVTTNMSGARDFGIAEDSVFGFWDWVGGRFSVWSAIGLPIALAGGMGVFRDFLAGARAMDRHFLDAPLAENLPVLLALTGIWNRNFEGAGAHAVLPYTELLDILPPYLQQLEMESNGKSTDLDGAPVAGPTAPVIFGQAGTDGQHAFYQLLHQGTELVSSDFIAAVEDTAGQADHHDKLLANFLAQTAALALGRPDSPDLPAHKAFPGNRPTTSILLDRLDAHRLGMLLALYEHKVFVQGAIWNVNSFDQFGVELGKELAAPLVGAVAGGDAPDGLDCSTRSLLARIRRVKSGGDSR
jgi:glucose-6-phosphate isomerase